MVAIYARFSRDRPNLRSIEDQIRLLRERADCEGWTIYECYTDYAMSGATIARGGALQMLQDAQDGKFDIILVESLDRLSRDQADTAIIYKHMQFAGVEIITLYEGRVGILEVGLRGTANQLQLVDTANKVRRGQRGRVERGLVASSLSYGYDVVNRAPWPHHARTRAIAEHQGCLRAPLQGSRRWSRRCAQQEPTQPRLLPIVSGSHRRGRAEPE